MYKLFSYSEYKNYRIHKIKTRFVLPLLIISIFLTMNKPTLVLELKPLVTILLKQSIKKIRQA